MVDLEVPARQYEDDRHTWFQLVARHAKATPLQLRVALSNVFVTMTTRHRQHPNTTTTLIDEHDYDDDAIDVDDGLVDCSWCGGVGSSDCDDPIQCLDPRCNGEWCRCTACDGRGHSQVSW